jgi:hypothetical protein
MTEAEWLACGDPHLMVEFVRGKGSHRKLRLFAAYSFRSLLYLLPDPRQHRAVDTLEQMAEGTASVRDRQEAVRDTRLALPAYSQPGDEPADDPYFVALMLFREFRSSSVGTHAWAATAGVADSGTVRREQCELLRDIFGNPFRPVPFDPRWRTTDALGLARGICEDRAFDRLPLLADALMDAGCDSAALLDHCRGPGPHVRGCWVVDLVLGKE